MSTTWNRYWLDRNKWDYWTQPDPAAVELVSRLNRDQIREVLDLG